MMPDLETGGMISLMSSIGSGLMTEIKRTPGSCCYLKPISKIEVKEKQKKIRGSRVAIF